MNATIVGMSGVRLGLLMTALSAEVKTLLINEHPFPIIAYYFHMSEGVPMEWAKAKLRAKVNQHYPEIEVRDEHMQLVGNDLCVAYKAGTGEPLSHG